MAHKLLLADDSVTIQRVIELTFADEDVQVAVVGDGKQAIDRIQADRPDIVLADTGMPVRDGYEVAAFIKTNPELAHIPVVLLTGAFDPIDENRARSVGCDAVLVKPFEPQMVISRVKELLSGVRPARPAEARPAAAEPPDTDRGIGPASAAQPGSDGDSLEDYFDRLDAAFADLENRPKKPAAEASEPAAEIAEIEDVQPPPALRQGAEHSPTTWEPEVAGELGPGRPPDLASAFAALLAAEQGQPLPQVAFAAPATTPAPPAITEEVIDEIARRVVTKMADESMRRLVLDTAERLVREEIERIKRS